MGKDHMTYQYSLSRPTKKAELFWFKPLHIWLLLIATFLFAILGARLGLGSILNYFFPAWCLGLGIYLYSRYPRFYVGFNFWLWFLIAFIRRLADYWSSYTEPSPILTAPFLVTGIPILTLLVRLPAASRDGSLPFTMAFVGVLYGLCVGLSHNLPMSTLILSLLGLITPIGFGYFFYINWRDYLQYKENLQKIFLWGTLVMGIYGIIQFISLPEWDRLWLIQSGMFTSQGMPNESGGLRVWSTMHSGEPFAAFMSVGLLLLLSVFGSLPFFASIPGYLSLLLSTVRSAWLGWFCGLLVMVTNLKPNIQIRLISFALIIALAVIPLSFYEPFAAKIMPRLLTFSNLEEDTSGQQRQQIYTRAAKNSHEIIIGRGIGDGVGDSGILSIFFQLGILGSALYLGGVILIIYRLFYSKQIERDIFISALKAGVMSCLVRLPFNSVVAGGSGVLFWTLLGLGLASTNYYGIRNSSASDNEV